MNIVNLTNSIATFINSNKSMHLFNSILSDSSMSDIFVSILNKMPVTSEIKDSDNDGKSSTMDFNSV